MGPRGRPRLSGASATVAGDAGRQSEDSRRPPPAPGLCCSKTASFESMKDEPNRRPRMRSSSVAVEWTSAGCRGDRWAPRPAPAAADCGKIAVISLTALPKTRGKLENAPLRFPRCGCSIAQPRQLFEGKNQGVKPASKSRVLPPLALRPVESSGPAQTPLRPYTRAATREVASDLVLTAY